MKPIVRNEWKQMQQAYLCEDKDEWTRDGPCDKIVSG